MAKTIFITGASSGIGKGLAAEFAKRGYHLGLAARRMEALETIKKELNKEYAGIKIEYRTLDVTDTDQVRIVIDDMAKTLGHLDIIIANAGIGGGGAAGTGKFREDKAIIMTNVIGAMATVDSAVALFRQQKSGHIVAISSVAACRGMPGAGAYCASKAALATYMEAVSAELYRSPVDVTTLFPGYIDTAINEKLKSRPFLISVEKGSRIMADLIEKKVSKSTVPVYPWNLISKALKMIPTSTLAKQAPFD